MPKLSGSNAAGESSSSDFYARLEGVAVLLCSGVAEKVERSKFLRSRLASVISMILVTSPTLRYVKQ